jgi:ATP-dependent helicase HrpA
VSLRLFATRADSVESTRSGLLALYGARFTAELSVLRKDLAISRNRWPLFEGLGGQEAAGRDLLAFVLAELFATRDGKLPGRSAFQARVESLKGGALFTRAREVHDEIMGVLEQRRRVLDLLTRHQRGGGADAARVPAMRRELERILPGDFLHTLHAGHLPDVLRYLKALHTRIERAHLAPAKDAQRQAQVEPHLERLAVARDAGLLTAEQADLVDEFDRMIEELRVSLFAQEVGTAFPISAKRLDKKWDELRGAIEIRPAR